MRSKAIKTATMISAACCLISMSGCFLRPITKKYSYEQASEELLKCIEVKEPEGAVPEGMEVMYVMTRKVYMDYEGHSSDYRYEHDGEGRETAMISDKDETPSRVSRTFNDDGTVASKEKVTTGEVKGYRSPDFRIEFKYNDDGQLVSFSEKKELSDSEEITTEEYE